MPHRAIVSLELSLDREASNRLDEVVQLSAGKLDREQAALLAFQHGLAVLEHQAQAYAAAHVGTCPRCREDCLAALEIGGVKVQACSGCGGHWLDNEAAQRIVERPSAELVEHARDLAVRAQNPVATSAKVSCPVCGDEMTHRDMPVAEVRLDLCPKHGTWFDRAELGRLAAVLVKQKQQAAELERLGASFAVEMDRRDREWAERGRRSSW